MPHNLCSWSGSEKAVHVAMAHTRSLAEEYRCIYQKTPATELCYVVWSIPATSGSLGAGIKKHRLAALQK